MTIDERLNLLRGAGLIRDAGTVSEREYLFQHALLQEAAYDSLFAANLVKEYLWWPDRPLNYQANRDHTISQHLPDIYRVTNGLYMRDKDSILRTSACAHHNGCRSCKPNCAWTGDY